jgi:hypothetical protein
VRLRDGLDEPDAKHEDGEQCGYSANARANRLNEVDATDDFFILFPD